MTWINWDKVGGVEQLKNSEKSRKLDVGSREREGLQINFPAHVPSYPIESQQVIVFIQDLLLRVSHAVPHMRTTARPQICFHDTEA